MLSPDRDGMSVIVVMVMVSTLTEVTDHRGEQNTGLIMRSFKLRVFEGVPCSPIGHKCLP